MMFNLTFHAHKGGQGTTTVASAFAIYLASTGRDVLAVGNADMANVLGLGFNAGTEEAVRVGPNLWFVNAAIADRDARALGLPADVEPWVIGEPIKGAHGRTCPTVEVVSNCYLALRASAAHGRADVTVAVIEQGRAMGRREVFDVLGVEAVTVHREVAISRVVDAGLMASRLPRGLREAMVRLHGELGGHLDDA